LSGRFLLLGKVTRPHGRDNLLRIRSFAISETSFLNAGKVFLRPVSGEIHEFKVISVRPHQNIYLMLLEGLCSRDEADKYRDAEIYIDKESLTREEEEYFWYELLGLDVYMNTGEYLGSVSQIISAASNDIYVVKEKDKEIFIPATHEVVRKIDLENQKMIISAMEGLLDLNEV
jgi:16S rRNA processing protein RimM